MNLQQHILEWLDSIGADGLMYPDGLNMDQCFIAKDDLEKVMIRRGHAINTLRVPAYRHADGAYHTFPTICENCIGRKDEPSQEDCYAHEPCATAQSWLSRKGGDNA